MLGGASGGELRGFPVGRAWGAAAARAYPPIWLLEARICAHACMMSGQHSGGERKQRVNSSTHKAECLGCLAASHPPGRCRWLASKTAEFLHQLFGCRCANTTTIAASYLQPRHRPGAAKHSSSDERRPKRPRQHTKCASILILSQDLPGPGWERPLLPVRVAAVGGKHTAPQWPGGAERLLTHAK
jgi:hypothetical protein